MKLYWKKDRALGQGRGLSLPTTPLNVDLILREIFRSCDVSDLFQFRLVSHKWNSVATPQLLTATNIHVNIHHSSKLKEFVRLLKKHTPQGRFAYAPFPCSNLRFEKTCLNSKSFLTFMNDKLVAKVLSIHGPFIHKLSLNFSSRASADDMKQYGEPQVTEQLRNLVLYKTPNISSLKLDIAIPAPWKLVMEVPRDDYSPLTVVPGEVPAGPGPGPGNFADDEDTIEIDAEAEAAELAQVTALNPNCKNSKLKVLNFAGFGKGQIVTSQLIDLLITIAPNLTEIKCNEHYYIYFLAPLDRLQYLKKLVFTPYTEKHLDILEIIADWKLNVELRELHIYFARGYFDTGALFALHDTKVRAGAILSRILKGNRKSLELIHWSGLTQHVSVTWPRVMPNVTCVTFGNPFYITVRQGSVSLYPNGFSWGVTFPSLKCIGLYDNVKFESFGDFLDFVRAKPCAQVPKVRIMRKRDIHPNELNTITKLFPKARVERCNFLPFLFLE